MVYELVSGFVEVPDDGTVIGAGVLNDTDAKTVPNLSSVASTV